MLYAIDIHCIIFFVRYCTHAVRSADESLRTALVSWISGIPSRLPADITDTFVCLPVNIYAKKQCNYDEKGTWRLADVQEAIGCCWCALFWMMISYMLQSVLTRQVTFNSNPKRAKRTFPSLLQAVRHAFHIIIH